MQFDCRTKHYDEYYVFLVVPTKSHLKLNLNNMYKKRMLMSFFSTKRYKHSNNFSKTAKLSYTYGMHVSTA